MLILALKLILAHLIGDFLCQPTKWVKHKEKHKHKSKFLYWHVLVHFLALIAVLQFNFNYWAGILIIVASHYIIDLLKLSLKKQVNNRLLFALDQLAHFIIIALVVCIYEPYNLSLNFLFETKTLLFITSFICITQVASVIMKTIISKWDLRDFDNESSLKDAGAYIGILERLFVFMFIITNHWEGVGFLIAAKSVFRFGDLSKAKDRKLTEYVLIGTLLSFGLAIFFALGYNYILDTI
ncbi:DUF3307 domain-containing protein [Tamlana sp. 2_MG-2023]|uniref:DUF3307 domain-containing protein n=1 Tax=unclassified Tamlana TaxID=2614803 RepID=UPI0026E1405A|nr:MULTISPECIES: DUF3307 domain-containing protein [unclassified Tamlana]MDO6759198.1 DUF3307 domain-containing protein [Tamlana sp. 2_MG-2023]MDO6790663.1 DUF3307 domain-containing protein [Tamlana sp. 1_MG-2023]